MFLQTLLAIGSVKRISKPEQKIENQIGARAALAPKPTEGGKTILGFEPPQDLVSAPC